jgi:hypothetical protein
MASYLFGIPVILWVFAVLALAVACLLVFGRRKIPDFSKESVPLIVTPAVAAVEILAGADEEEDPDETTPLPTKVNYAGTTICPELERQITNPAGLFAKPQYNPTGIDNWVFGSGQMKNQHG